MVPLKGHFIVFSPYSDKKYSVPYSIFYSFASEIQRSHLIQDVALF